jgi:hypothetical protein
MKGGAPERRSKGGAPERRSKGRAPERRSKGEAPERRSKGGAPERALDDNMRKHTLLLGAEGAMVERGLLPTLSYREKQGMEGSMSTLRIESTQLLGVPWIFDVYPCLGVV